MDEPPRSVQIFHYCSWCLLNASNNRFSTQKARTFWRELKLEFITHYVREDSKVEVIAKAWLAQRKSKWIKFMHILNGQEIRIGDVHRSRSMLDQYKGTAYESELYKNIFKLTEEDEDKTVSTKTKSPEKISSNSTSLDERTQPVVSNSLKTTPAKDRKSPSPKDKKKKRVSAIDKLSPLPKKKSTKRAAKYSTSPEKGLHADEREANCPVVHLFRTEISRVLPSDNHCGTLHNTIMKVLGAQWSRGNCMDLRVYWLLEVHRRTLRLEQAMAKCGVDVKDLSLKRDQAFAARKYVLLDPITLGTPMLLGHLRGSFDVQADATYRLLAVAASILPLLRYGLELTTLARERMSSASLAEADTCLFEWPFPFLPGGMREALARSPVPSAVADITRRIDKEQVSRAAIFYEVGCKR